MSGRLTRSQAERLLHRDPVREFLYEGLTAPARRAVRSRMVIEVVAHVHATLADPLATEAEAYETFVRTISILSALLPEGRRR